MTQGQVLATRVLRADPSMGRTVSMQMTVYGGLHYIKGNNAPYFTLTSWSHRLGFPNQLQGGGANHDEILKQFKRFGDIAALHLSDIQGVPMHAAENGWYWLAGACGGLGERWHGGNSRPGKTPEQCLHIFAKHVRVKLVEAGAVQRHFSHGVLMRKDFNAWIDTQRPRWKAEAERCIRKHGLRVYGDPWHGDV